MRALKLLYNPRCNIRDMRAARLCYSFGRVSDVSFCSSVNPLLNWLNSCLSLNPFVGLNSKKNSNLECWFILYGLIMHGWIATLGCLQQSAGASEDKHWPPHISMSKTLPGHADMRARARTRGERLRCTMWYTVCWKAVSHASILWVYGVVKGSRWT
jgi:hypothetical protein